ncbi:MAG: hypothetical protein ABI600_12280 [Luteolibacter sp.]
MKPPQFVIKKRCKKYLVSAHGRAKTGKSLILLLLAECLGLLNNDKVMLIDTDEPADRDLVRADDSVMGMPMKTFDNVARIVSQAPEECTLILADTAGASQGFEEEVNKSQKFLEASNLEKIGIIFTPNQTTYDALTLRWLSIFKNSPRGFLIQNSLTPCDLTDSSPIPDGIEAPKEMTVLRIPHLDSDAANEISRLAVKFGTVIDGKVTPERSEILSLALYQDLVAIWANDTLSILKPLIDFLNQIIAVTDDLAADSSTSETQGEKASTKPLKVRTS